MQDLYKVPNQQQRKLALGSLPGLSYRLKKCLQQVLKLSKPMKKPKKGQWLWQHQQEGQTFLAYEGQLHNVVDKKRNIIYIKPLQNMEQKFLNILKQYCECFFYPLKIKISKKGQLKNIPHRINQYSQRQQFNAKQILLKLEKQLPSDGFCIIGICFSDLYPKDQWNFVFGLASIRQRTGVFSFARYDQRFYQTSEYYQPNYDKIMWRSIGVMIHQVTHMFGIRHCVHYECIMNGSNSLEQSAGRPLQLCVVCLRKLQSNINFDILQRYQKIYNFIKKYGDKSKCQLKQYLQEIIQKIPLKQKI